MNEVKNTGQERIIWWYNRSTEGSADPGSTLCGRD